MFRKLMNLYCDWDVTIKVVGFLLAGIVMLLVIDYDANHQTVNVGQGIEVRVAGNCWFADKVKETGRANQFFASNELGFADMSMDPHFTLENTSSKPCEVRVHTLSAWEVPVAGNVYLEPGQRFEFQIHGKHKHWYCWINPLTPKKS